MTETHSFDPTMHLHSTPPRRWRRFLQDAGNAGVHFRQMRERSLPATCIAAGGS
jgi:hypothetical protein